MFANIFKYEQVISGDFKTMTRTSGFKLLHTFERVQNDTDTSKRSICKTVVTGAEKWSGNAINYEISSIIITISGAKYRGLWGSSLS